ncbi:MAG: sulfotransferase [Desulfobacterales bacterium]|nr:MAG: sulfotransferase [Desulfobacterales bacterium]
MPKQVICPIFIVGAPRSGTNIFYRTMAKHPDLAWISNITKKVPASLLLTRILMMFRSDHRPTEGNNIWQKFIGDDDESLGRKDVTRAARKFLHKVVRNNLQLFNKPRFLNKCPGNSVRIEFLKEIFPDAIFIHLIRDGRAAAYSIMRSRLKHNGSYWSVKPPGWQDLLKLPLVDACALQWKMIVESVLQSAAKLPPEQYVEVKYEDFVVRPAETLKHVAAKCDLIWQDNLLQSITGGMEDRNFKWLTGMRDEDKHTLNELLGDFMKQLGYEAPG